MAKNKVNVGTRVTLVGQSDSGKTNLLATLLGNTNAHADLLIGPDKVAAASVSANTEETGDEQEVDRLLGYANNILRGQVLDNSGTDGVTVYPCSLSYQDITPGTTKSGVFGSRTTPDRVGPQQTVKFSIVDGRGGDIAPNEFLDPADPQNAAAIARQQEYRDRLNESIGAIMIMPMDKNGFKIDLANRLVQELKRTIAQREQSSTLPPLKYLAICYTKYDELFTHRGATAGEKAADFNEAISYLKDTAIVKVFESLFTLTEGRNPINICIFPVSTFGFVNETGAANFYNLKGSPGLLTRAVNPQKDWKSASADTPTQAKPVSGKLGAPKLGAPKLGAPDDVTVAAKTEKKGPDLKSHFPFEVSENDAKTLWRPFNIAPPLMFALTGKVTGPLYLYPDEVMTPVSGR